MSTNTCPVCHEETFTGLQLCTGQPHPGSAVCIVCMYRLIMAGHLACCICRFPLDPNAVREIQQFLPVQQQPQQPQQPVQNVQEVMNPHPSPTGTLVNNRNVRPRRLEPEFDQRDRTAFIQRGIDQVGVRFCSRNLTHNYDDMRYDLVSPEARFVMCNGSDCTGRPDPSRTSGFVAVQGALPRFVYYVSTHDDHLPPYGGALIRNDHAKIPNWARPQIEEHKIFLLRDQRARDRPYDPWKFGYRPSVGSRDEASAQGDISNIYSDSITVGRPFYYQHECNTFRSLAFAWALEVKIIPTMRTLGQHPKEFIDFSPVWCSRTRSNHDPGFTYTEFEMIVALSYRKPPTGSATYKWRSGPLLFLQYRKINDNWGIAGPSCALFNSPDTPPYNLDFPYRGLNDDIVAYYNNLP